jgi:hypothetical protein
MFSFCRAHNCREMAPATQHHLLHCTRMDTTVDLGCTRPKSTHSWAPCNLDVHSDTERYGYALYHTVPHEPFQSRRRELYIIKLTACRHSNWLQPICIQAFSTALTAFSSASLSVQPSRWLHLHNQIVSPHICSMRQSGNQL